MKRTLFFSNYCFLFSKKIHWKKLRWVFIGRLIFKFCWFSFIKSFFGQLLFIWFSIVFFFLFRYRQANEESTEDKMEKAKENQKPPVEDKKTKRPTAVEFYDYDQHLADEGIRSFFRYLICNFLLYYWLIWTVKPLYKLLEA